MTALEKLDAFYAQSLETSLSGEKKNELKKILEGLVSMSDEFLTSFTADLCNERKTKFRKMRELICDELTQIEHESDVLCHYALIREYLEDTLNFVQRGCYDET